MATLAELVSNKNLPNEMKITLPDGAGEITLGDIRSLEADRARQVNEEFARLNKVRAETSEFYARATALGEQLEARRRELDAATAQPQRGTATDYDINQDPYLSPVMEEVRGLRSALAERDAAIATLRSNETEMVAAFIEKDLDAQFGSVKDLPPDINKEKLLRYAVENGIVDKHKLPDLRTAAHRMTEPQRTEKALREAEDRGREKARIEGGARGLGRMTPGLPSMAPPGAESPFKGRNALRDAFAAAKHDPEIVGNFP